ncbi:MAG: 3,5-cyclic-AMP phosphodiesterase [Acidimicrobiia bacterium]|nr:3,5-cyclic-AMP phosphodiesterase [Acidimicrobiia bacterium]
MFAVDDTTAQVVWGEAPVGPVQVEAGGRGGYAGGHGPGAAGGYLIEGLQPGTVYDVVVSSTLGHVAHHRARTLERPPGELLCRVATVSDLHIGSRDFGLFHTMRDPRAEPEPVSLRCARLAVEEAVRWGAQLLVVKGDLTDRGWHDEWRAAMSLLRRAGVPIVAALGNHETGHRREVDASTVLKAAGVAYPDPLHVTDLPGVRVITVDSALDAQCEGSLSRALPDLLDALVEADRPALVCLHHPFDRWPIPTKYPTGIRWPEATEVLEKIKRAKRDVFITAGHAHRNRRREVGSMVVTEVASTKDYPGVWGGYAIYDGGLIQLVRRIQAPSAMAWTEYTRRAAGGIWGWYAPGRLRDRCFTHRWPLPTPARSWQAVASSGEARATGTQF